MMIVVAVVGLLASLAVPSMAKARDTARLNTIYSNLRQLDQAKAEWALQTHQPDGAPVDDISVLAGFFRDGGLHDVMDETYIPNAVGTPPEADLPSGVRLGQFGPGAAITAP